MKLSNRIGSKLYQLRAAHEDRRFGGSMEEIRPSRFKARGAEATQSSDYRCMDRLFEQLRFNNDDLLVDVGCGQGRVLAYLRRRHFPGRLIGVELDPEVAAEAADRVGETAHTEIRCGDILEQRDLLREAAYFYLFNPFNGKIFSKFIDALEKERTAPVTLIYLFDYYGEYLRERPGWTCLWCGDIPRAGRDTAHGSIWNYKGPGTVS